MIGAASIMILLQITACALVWVVSPWPAVSILISLVSLAGLWLGARLFIATLPTLTARLFALLLWQLPGLICGFWTLLQIAGFLGRHDTPPFILQAWLNLIAPWWNLLPGIFIRGVGLYLWFASLVPFAMTMLWLIPSRPGRVSGDRPGDPGIASARIF